MPKEADQDIEDDEEVVAELARRLRPLETLEAKQRRLEDLEARQRMLNDLESSHRSLDEQGAVESHGCGGGCSQGRVRSRVSEDLEAQYAKDLRPRPIFGLLNDILETAQYGFKVDSPRAHFIF